MLRVVSGRIAVIVVAALLAAGCSGGSPKQATPAGAKAKAAQVTITPADGRKEVRPDKGITVSVKDGTLQQVKAADADGDAVAGKLSADRRTWKSTWT
ncbi:MAG: hypothetical protein GEV11_00790, partial [Streptosporangiales bacterium]|nr:hypothetical protein [Streptosporangiales bacterium]